MDIQGGSAMLALTLSGYDAKVAGRIQTEKYIDLKDGVTAPSTLTGYARIYVDTSGGDLKVKFSDGTVKTIVTDS